MRGGLEREEGEGGGEDKELFELVKTEWYNYVRLYTRDLIIQYYSEVIKKKTRGQWENYVMKESELFNRKQSAFQMAWIPVQRFIIV